ncbi:MULTISPECIES: type II secretion system minor pseudopilin GspK [Achromobacter]|jgi:general secretion pathway protein K|uniref:Type II secretion system protein K n=2 Tax=Achromobacter TaxID=222 RepID=A0A6J5BDJ2_9BURK|nr:MULTISPECIES: type II secretion system minor pseudopilin GspK [Achromobacter]CAB3699655.1 Type II secretion system protein K [Achromobacter insuavis]CUJ78997.1 Type II secretory pathway%2C component PulK [Achromobacter sp. 2789STDY5608633]CUJ80649.1 Type II secretory pathway%2C component PulK [Achromobacter sp. 2789STDY5608628]
MAVISALLVVAAVTMIVASLLQRQDTFLRAVQAAQSRAQAQALLEAGLGLARQRLREDGQRQATTRPDGVWAAPIVDTRLQRPGRDAAFVGRLEDEQGKFNLRNLVFEGRLYQDGVAELLRLCALVGVAPEVGQAIAERILAAQPGADPHGRLAPLPRSLEELAGVPGVDAAVLARLRRHVTVLPRVTLVNVNTASAEVIAAHVPGMSLDQAKAMVAQRDGGLWFVNNGDFANRLSAAEGAADNGGGASATPAARTEAPRVAVASGWFRLDGAARLGGMIQPLKALLTRGGDGVSQIIWSREGA